MTEHHQTTEAGPPDAAKRQARAYRILDASAELILRWGYNKTTIDDIARLAGVAKGTIYLHWKTREDLFAALMKREKVELGKDFMQRITVDPAAWTLHAMLKHSALALMNRPLLKAALLRDIDVLGKLAHTEHSSAAYTERMSVFKTYLEFLREQGLVRTDLSVRAQVYMISAIFMGFFLVAPLMPDEFVLSNEELAELIAETVHCTLEHARPETAGEDQTLTNAFLHYVNRATTIAQEQLQQAVAP